MNVEELARILVEKYKSVQPPKNVCSHYEPTIFVKGRILVSPPRGSTHNEGELDLRLPLKPTIFMTQRNSERRSKPPKKGFFKKLAQLWNYKQTR